MRRNACDSNGLRNIGQPMKRGSAPVYLNLLRIRMPVTAVVSFAHRVSGVLLFAVAPGLIYLLSLSLRDPSGFDRAAAVLTSLPVRVLGVLVVWALMHHLLAGLRFLGIDLEWGISRAAARASAFGVLLLSLVLAMLFVTVWL